ncbi:MAG: M18 family aminopeptidase [Proteobacteria bacterium]|jgi:aspartyl aminopeptidase|nr:M18 family aminopeptidase [Pseudomonadota bacterium]MBT6193012.1 M18 family aminopeptidase [Pseudomonadota bacterium]MBT6464878.1 M18 family aminopeptidase [Pseudomonadota bacterium]MBT6674983.1 M18 family aminopeptidase [Pseudomonadota bacterium]MBT7245592.1 M18 family aminopeptidase [Pseudomonadota bacterium]
MSVNKNLLDFINRSPTPFHAVKNMRTELVKHGFKELRESESEKLEPSGQYFVVRNNSSLVAFRVSDKGSMVGVRMVGAHTDSPCLKLKPNAVVEHDGYVQLGVEPYGGVLMNPWFDRDLSLAGRVTLMSTDKILFSRLIDFETPIAFIPSLAIHLDREANSGRKVNPQTMLPPVVGLSGTDKFNLKQLILDKLVDSQLAKKTDVVSDFELSLYDTNPAAIIGLDEAFIAGSRLDNLVSCWIGLKALIDSSSVDTQLLICNDHEEVGSGSFAGARSDLLESVLVRLVGDAAKFSSVMSRSLLVSADNAHGLHPNFLEKHDQSHGPVLNAGPVLKFNANQSYATNSETAAILNLAARNKNIPMQSFVSRSDIGCGSTIGPLTSTRLGVKALDVGIPTFGMHSIRELAGARDLDALYSLLCGLFELPSIEVA